MESIQQRYGIPPSVAEFVTNGFLEVVSEEPGRKTVEFHIPALRRSDERGRIRTYSLVWIHPEGADIYQIAKNCRTSVEMFEKHYAAHIRTTLDAAAINVRRSRPHQRLRRATTEKRTRENPIGGAA